MHAQFSVAAWPIAVEEQYALALTLFAFMMPNTIFRHDQSTVGAGLLSKAVGQLQIDCLALRVRQQAGSYTFRGVLEFVMYAQFSVAAWPIAVEEQCALALTLFAFMMPNTIFRHDRSTVGAGLLLKAVGQLQIDCLALRVRQQAGSYTFSGVLEFVMYAQFSVAAWLSRRQSIRCSRSHFCRQFPGSGV
ncbi:MAG: hypothetical protein ACRER8_03505 [Pseudomonas sp.]|uniref:hypothetical protein n=1 Tax=Pseudomonas sp. TaxID=306 RepID=UPI003D6EDC80